MNLTTNQKEERSTTATMLISIIVVFALQISVVAYAFYRSAEHYSEAAIEEAVIIEKQQYTKALRYREQQLDTE